MVIVPVVHVEFEVVEDFTAPCAARAASAVPATAAALLRLRGAPALRRRRTRAGNLLVDPAEGHTANLRARPRYAPGARRLHRHAGAHGNSGLAERRTAAREAARRRAPRRFPMRNCWPSCCVPEPPGTPRSILARDVLQSFHSLRKLIAADRSDSAPSAVLARRYAELQAAVEIARRQLSETLRAGPSLASPRATRDFLTARLRDLEHDYSAAFTSTNAIA